MVDGNSPAVLHANEINTRSRTAGSCPVKSNGRPGSSNQPEDLASSPLHACAFRPSDDLDLAAAAAAAEAAASLAAPESFLSLKKPNTGREHTGMLSTTGATRTPDE
jgi:hypothetical protein